LIFVEFTMEVVGMSDWFFKYLTTQI
jgi:hypothetical protein